MRTITLLVALVAALLASPPAAAAPTWRWPVEGRVITPYRNGADPYAAGQHRGIDIAAPTGTAVVAAAGGTMTFAGLAGSSGLTVAVRTDDGFDTSYLHLSAVRVRVGDRVAAGVELGSVGTTGRRSAAEPHVHFGVREAGSRFAYRDPLDFLPAPPLTTPLPKAAPAPVAAPVGPRAARVVAPRGLVPVPVAGDVAVVAAPALGPHIQPGSAPHALGPALAGGAAAAAGRGAPSHGAGTSRRAGAPAGRAHPVTRARYVPRPSAHVRQLAGDRHPRARAAPSPAAGPRPATGGTPLPPPRALRPAHASHGSLPHRGGIDLGWLAACLGLVAAATLLARPRERSVRHALGLSLPPRRSLEADR